MRDGIFVLLTVGFFALAGAYVRACGLIIRRDGTGPERIDPDGLGADGFGADLAPVGDETLPRPQAEAAAR